MTRFGGHPYLRKLGLGVLFVAQMAVSNYGARADTLVPGELVQVDTSDDPREWAFQPTMKVDPVGSLHSVWTQNHVEFSQAMNAYILYRRSDDGALGGVVLLSSRLDGVYNEGPQICLGDAGQVYVAWGQRYSGQIRFARSLDRGQNWDVLDSRVGSTSTVALFQPVQMNCLGNGHVSITWVDARDGQSHIYSILSTDDGSTWGPEVRVDSSSGNATTLVSTDDGQGDLILAWLDNRFGQNRIYANNSNDGVTWQATDSAVSDREGIFILNHYRPSMAADSQGHVYVAWSYEDRAAIVFKRSLDGGATWQDEQVVCGSNSQGIYGSVAFRGDGRVYSACLLDVGVSWAAAINVSNDNGGTWLTAERVAATTDNPYAAIPPSMALGMGDDVYVVFEVGLPTGYTEFASGSTNDGVNWAPKVRVSAGNWPDNGFSVVYDPIHNLGIAGFFTGNNPTHSYERTLLLSSN